MKKAISMILVLVTLISCSACSSERHKSNAGSEMLGYDENGSIEETSSEQNEELNNDNSGYKPVDELIEESQTEAATSETIVETEGKSESEQRNEIANRVAYEIYTAFNYALEGFEKEYGKGTWGDDAYCVMYDRTGIVYDVHEGCWKRKKWRDEEWSKELVLDTVVQEAYDHRYADKKKLEDMVIRVELVSINGEFCACAVALKDGYLGTYPKFNEEYVEKGNTKLKKYVRGEEFFEETFDEACRIYGDIEGMINKKELEELPKTIYDEFNNAYIECKEDEALSEHLWEGDVQYYIMYTAEDGLWKLKKDDIEGLGRIPETDLEWHSDTMLDRIVGKMNVQNSITGLKRIEISYYNGFRACVIETEPGELASYPQSERFARYAMDFDELFEEVKFD